MLPLGFAALIALPIILWLHLRRSKLRRVEVPSLLLWEHLPLPTTVKRRRWLPMTLLLLLHLAIAALLAGVLAYPQGIGQALSRSTHTVVILDTSTSMAATDTRSGSRLEHARNRARLLLGNMGVRDRITLIAAGQGARVLVSGELTEQAALQQALEALDAGGTGSDIGGALALARTALERTVAGQAYDSTRIVVVSDLEPPQTRMAMDERVEWVRVGENPGNRAIVAFAARPRGSRATSGDDVYVRIANYGDASLTTHFRLYGDDELLDTRLVGLKPEAEVELTWNLPPGTDIVRAEVDGQDLLPIDDSATLSLDQSRPIQTVLVSGGAPALERAFAAIPNVDLEMVAPAAYATSSAAENADLIVFHNTLTQTVEWPAGGVLVINPPVASPLLQVSPPQPLAAGTLHVGEEARETFGRLNLDSIEFGDVARLQVPEWADVTLASGDVPLIVRGRTGQSEVAVWTFHLEQSNMTTRLAFPLLLARTVRDLVPPPMPGMLVAGSPLEVHPAPHADTLELRPPDGRTQTFDVRGRYALALDHLAQPGLYTVVEKRGSDVLYQGQVAVNAGTPTESDLRARPSAAVAGLEPIPPAPVAPDQAGFLSLDDTRPLWTWFLLAVLLLLMVEWVYALLRRQGVQR